jgi:hypothetical protein
MAEIIEMREDVKARYLVCHVTAEVLELDQRVGEAALPTHSKHKPCQYI